MHKYILWVIKSWALISHKVSKVPGFAQGWSQWIVISIGGEWLKWLVLGTCLFFFTSKPEDHQKMYTLKLQ